MSDDSIISYEDFYAGMKDQLRFRLPAEILMRKPDFKVRSNRMQMVMDGITGSHYEICLRKNYHEIALHFESSPERSISRRQAFDSLLDDFSHKLGFSIRAGKLENRGWQRVWIELPLQDITNLTSRILFRLICRIHHRDLPNFAGGFPERSEK